MRQHRPHAVRGDEVGQRRHVVGARRERHHDAAVGHHQRRRERIRVDRHHVAVPAEAVERLAERAHDVDAQAGAGEQHRALAHRSQPPVEPLYVSAGRVIWPQRPPQDARVEPQRPVLDVPDVELDPARPRDRRAAVDLRPAGHARAASRSRSRWRGV